MTTVTALVLMLLVVPPSAAASAPGQALSSPPAAPVQNPSSPAPVPQAPSQPTLVAPVVPVPETYVIGRQDQIKITVFEDDALNAVYTVDADGTILFPYVNRIMAAGLTLRQLQDKLRSALSPDIIRNPQIRAEIDKFKSQSVMITGEVRTPSKVAMMGSKSLLEAITEAGSLNSTASTEITVTHTSGKVETVDYKDVLAVQAFQLHDGDVVTVPKAQLVYIQGEVKNTGSYVWQRDMTLAQLVTLAGGLNDRGKYGGAYAVRLVNGKPTQVSLKEQDRVLADDQVHIKKRIL